MTARSVDLSIVIPVYNEADNIEPLYAVLKAVLDASGRSYEVIIVDDGSKDESYSILKRLALADPLLKVIRFRRNFGQTAAFSAGFDYAQGNVIITMDADLQNDPQDIPRLLAEMERSGADVVSGWRAKRQEPFLTRRLPSTIANSLISWATGVPLHDYGCSLKAYRREIVKNIRLYGDLHRFIPAIASWMGIQVVEVPVQDHPRRHGKSKYGLSRTMKVILDLLTVRFLLSYSARPMRIFGFVGLLSFGVGLAINLYLSIYRLALHRPIADRPLLLLGILLNVVGVQMISMGLLAELIIRVYHEAQGKPIYVIKETIGITEDWL